MRLLVCNERPSTNSGKQEIVDPHAGEDPSPWAVVANEPIDSPALISEILPGVQRIVIDSRPSIALEATDPAHGPGEAAQSFAVWGPEGRRQLQEVLDRIVPIAAAAGATVCIVPHASGFVSDIPTCTDLLRRWAGAPVSLLLEPAALLTRSMARNAAEHFDRMAESLIDTGRIAALRLRKLQDAEPRGVPRAAFIRIGQRAARKLIPVIVPSSEEAGWTARLAGP